jgi:hypothetical protein
MPKEDGKAVNDTAVEETAPTASATEETNSPTVAEPLDLNDDATLGDDWDDEPEQETDSEDAEETEEPESEDENSEDTEETEEQPEAEKPAEEVKPQTKGEKRKEQLNTEIRDLVSERNRIKAEVEQLNGSVYQVPTVDQLVEQVNPATGDYFSRMEAEIATMKQQSALRDYNDKVAESRLSLVSDTQRALRDFPQYDETSKDYDEEAASQVQALIEPNLIRDPNVPEIDPNTRQPTGRGVVIGSRVSPYTIIKTLADNSNRASARSQVKAQKATEKMLSTADPGTGSHVKPKAKDEGLDAFDEEAERW